MVKFSILTMNVTVHKGLSGIVIAAFHLNVWVGKFGQDLSVFVLLAEILMDLYVLNALMGKYGTPISYVVNVLLDKSGMDSGAGQMVIAPMAGYLTLYLKNAYVLKVESGLDINALKLSA
jgi:hypothetical protein